MQIDNSANSKRIAKNTILLYFRMLFLMLVSLYTNRVILNALGVEDYGIYNVVGGVVTMFSVLSSSLNAAISRFITFELGTGDLDRLKNIFSSSVTIQAIIALLVIILAETIGLWFLNNKMVIPDNRLSAANWCFQFSTITFAVNLLAVPYTASIIAHEKMSAFAYISIIEALGKFVVAWCIVINPIDRLIFFAIMVAVVAWSICLIYAWYCKKHFDECHYHLYYDHDLLKRMFGFAGWNFIGASSGILRDYGINIVLNLFWGPAVNASRGISMQVNNAVMGFLQNFLTALNPQITKSYAVQDINYTFKLVFLGARVSFFMLLLLSLPIIIETPTILSLWLKIVPDYAVAFVRLILIYIMVESISFTMVTLMLAIGDIKKYQIVVGGFQMLNLPVAYCLLKIGMSPEWPIIGSIFIAFGCLLLRLKMLSQMVSFPVKRFVKEVVFRILSVSSLSVIISLYLISLLESSLIRLFITCLLCTSILCTCIVFVGCNKRERDLLFCKMLLAYKKYAHRHN